MDDNELPIIKMPPTCSEALSFAAGKFIRCGEIAVCKFDGQDKCREHIPEWARKQLDRNGDSNGE